MQNIETATPLGWAKRKGNVIIKKEQDKDFILLLCHVLSGGAGRDRTDDLMNAIHALSQLSYSP